MTRPLDDLLIGDIRTVVSVDRLRSVTKASRELGVTPSQVSKALGRVEEVLQTELFRRSGNVLTPIEQAAPLLRSLRDLSDSARAVEDHKAKEAMLSVAAPSFLAMATLPLVASVIAPLSLRALELGAAQIRSFAGQGLFDVAITLGAERLPDVWEATAVGRVKMAAYAAPKLAKKLGASPSLDDVREIPFIVPVYASTGEARHGDAGFPIPLNERIIGHETGTIGVGLGIAAHSEQIVFGPAFAARDHVMSGRLVELKIPGVDIGDDLVLHTHVDRVTVPTRTKIAKILKAVAEGSAA